MKLASMFAGLGAALGLTSRVSKKPIVETPTRSIVESFSKMLRPKRLPFQGFRPKRNDGVPGVVGRRGNLRAAWVANPSLSRRASRRLKQIRSAAGGRSEWLE
jgi:hypothetical protein